MFTLSKRGQSKLVHDEYFFTKIRSTKYIDYWVCSATANNKRVCPVKAHTRKFGNIERVKIIGTHCHPQPGWK